MSEAQYYYSQQQQQCLILRGFEGPTTEACSRDYNQHLLTSRAGEASTSEINRLVGVGPSDSVNVIQGRQGGVAAGLVEAAVGDVATVDPFLLLLVEFAVITALYLLLGWYFYFGVIEFGRVLI